MGWAEDEAKKVSEAEEKVRKNREWQLHAAAVILEASPVFFERLCAQLKSDVDEFNAARGGVPVQLEKRGGSVQVTKDGSPSMCKLLVLNPNHGIIGISARTVRDSEVVTNDTQLRFSLGHDGLILLDGTLDMEKMSRRVLEDIFSSFRPG